VKVDMRQEEDKCEKYSNAVLVQKQYWQSVNDLLKGGCHRARSRREIHVTGGGRDASSEVEGSGSPSGRRVRTSRRRSAVSGRRPTATVKDHENFYRLACKLSGGSNIGPVLDILSYRIGVKINLSVSRICGCIGAAVGDESGWVGTIAGGIRENDQELLGVSSGRRDLKKFYTRLHQSLTVVGAGSAYSCERIDPIVKVRIVTAERYDGSGWIVVAVLVTCRTWRVSCVVSSSEWH